MSDELKRRRRLIDPPDVEKEKIYGDGGRSGYWERIKNTVVTEIPNTTFGDIGCSTQVKRELIFIFQCLVNPFLLKKYGLKQTRGILLHGPSGTGKTLLIKALANMFNVTLFLVSLADIASKWQGEQELTMNILFSYAKANIPSVIIFDEIDVICPDRRKTQDAEQKIVSIVLQNMDGFKNLDGVIVVGTTNLLQNIDIALLRPGRFDKIIEIPLPDQETREKIFEIHCRNKLYKEIDYRLLAEKSEGLSGADIEGVVQSVLQSNIRTAVYENREPDNLYTEDIIKALLKCTQRTGNTHENHFGLSYT